MLKDLEIILDKPENDYLHEREFESASSVLLNRQFIWVDGFGQKKQYDLVNRFFDYFETLFDAFGFNLVRDYKYGYVGIVPRHGVPMMRKLDTLLLLLLVKMHDEQSRKACTERGRSTPCLAVLLDLYEQLTGLEKPSRGDFLASIKRIARHGVIHIGDVDEQYNLPTIVVTPAITQLVTPDFIAKLDAFVDTHMEDSDKDELDHGSVDRSLDESDDDLAADVKTTNVDEEQ